ncbi:hypothetical protein K432DRAFT_260976, partial [Lepidopterella palustris CBS 459.81]
MWLINTQTLPLEHFFDEKPPPYAILSHTWEDQEIYFQEMESKEDVNGKKGYKKVKKCCNKAKEDGYNFAWVDTCWGQWIVTLGSIDKTSSAELSEAINSMFRWYENSDICAVYLGKIFDVQGYFKRSRWFTRGWSLQELIASSIVEFYTADCSAIGTKDTLKEQIAGITGIDSRALGGEDLSTYNVAERMSWAAFRETTRLEDKAYFLLGIFQVNMPLLYGEGRRAFLRLQEEILRTTEDYTIFAW